MQSPEQERLLVLPFLLGLAGGMIGVALLVAFYFTAAAPDKPGQHSGARWGGGWR